MIFSDRFRTYWNFVTGTSLAGDELVVPPWRFDFHNIDIFKENPLRRNLPLREIFYTAAWTLLFLGVLFSPLRLLGVTGFVLLVYSHLLYRSVWRQISRVELKYSIDERNVEVGSEMILTLKLVNTGSSPVHFAAVHVQFSGASNPNCIKVIHGLGAGESREVRCVWTADLNMGPHYIGPMHLTVSDFLGAHELTIRKNVREELVLRPPILPVAFLETRRANYGMLPGVIDIPVSGQSPTFLGLRQWRDGDSIRQIDWKRSMRTQDILVKEFERQSSTDVTLVLDLNQQVHSAFSDCSSIEMVKTAGISIANTLLRRQMRLQALVGNKWLPLGTGHHQLDIVYKYTVESRLVAEPIHQSLREKLPVIPSVSMAILVVTDFALMRSELLELLMHMKDREIELVGVLIDGIAFSDRVIQQARLKNAASHFLKHALTADKNAAKNLESCQRICDTVIKLGPLDDIAQKFREVV